MKAIAILAVALLATPALAGPAEDLAALHWIAGDWIQDKPNATVKEHWTIAPDGGLTGVGETIAPGRPPAVERMMITAEAAGVVFTAMPGGQPPTRFVRRPGPAGEAVFENKDHDFPQRVIYRHCEEDLCARIEGTVQGNVRFQDWRYQRAH